MTRVRVCYSIAVVLWAWVTDLPNTGNNVFLCQIKDNDSENCCLMVKMRGKKWLTMMINSNDSKKTCVMVKVKKMVDHRDKP